VLVQFGFEPFQMKKAELIATLNNFLIEQYTNGRRVVLIVDEAQNLSPRVLEEVRLLSGLETAKDKVMRIILAGQPELNEKLDMPELAQLTQRVRLRFHLTPLSREDTDHYIQHRLEVAGSEGRQIFAADTLPLIFRYTGGVPRLINTLCDTAMMAAFTQERDQVTLDDIKSALAELRWHEYMERSARLPTLRPNRGHSSSSQRSDPTLAHLLLSHKGESLGEFELKSGRFLIGRTPENDMQIDSQFISRHHAQVITTQNSSIVEDLNSTNGIAHNGKRIRRRVLNDGDVIQIGEHELAYMDERNSRLRPELPRHDDAVPMVTETMVLPERMAVGKPPANSDPTKN
jgi:general secretion pathway protein A